MLSEAWTAKALERLASRIRAPVTLELWNGERYQLSESPAVAIKLTSPAAIKYLKSGTLSGLGEAFVEGYLDVSGGLRDIIRVAEDISSSLTSESLRKRLLPGRRHSRKLDSEAIRFHYDVSNEFYQLWLDRNMVYSCAYFRTGQEDIDTAQEQKLDHICRKLQLKRASARYRLRLGRADPPCGRQLRGTRQRDHLEPAPVRLCQGEDRRRGLERSLRSEAARLPGCARRGLLRQDR